MYSEPNEKDSIVNCPLPKSVFPENMPLAMAYIPFQSWEKPYDTAVALNRGTIFPALDKPFIGERYCLDEGGDSK